MTITNEILDAADLLLRDENRHPDELGLHPAAVRALIRACEPPYVPDAMANRNAFMGLRIVEDKTLEPTRMELRLRGKVLRSVRLKLLAP